MEKSGKMNNEAINNILNEAIDQFDNGKYKTAEKTLAFLEESIANDLEKREQKTVFWSTIVFGMIGLLGGPILAGIMSIVGFHIGKSLHKDLSIETTESLLDEIRTYKVHCKTRTPWNRSG